MKQFPKPEKQQSVPKPRQEINLVKMVVKDMTNPKEASKAKDKESNLEAAKSIQFGNLPAQALINMAFTLPSSY